MPGKSTDVNYLVKGTKIRMEMPGARGDTMVMIFDMAEKKMLILMSAQKMYMEQELRVNVADTAGKLNDAKIKHTGKTETIAGYKCEHVLAAAAAALPRIPTGSRGWATAGSH